ncbi:hypothetical protein [Jannaschia aquimarina]|uniref:hypothetical protein n=1 Tax=Jannaschia aquimarina TaxID=935700 RepID=UPI0005C44FE4|nr:hypothetical protein [Jannaschia aquimarina]
MAFDGRRLLPDRPLVHLYPSSMFDLWPMPSGEAALREGRPTLAVTLPSEHIEVFCDGRWYPKRLAIGRMIRGDILKRGSADGIVYTRESAAAHPLP